MSDFMDTLQELRELPEPELRGNTYVLEGDGVDPHEL